MPRVFLPSLSLALAVSALGCRPRPPAALPGRGMKPAECYSQCVEGMGASSTGAAAEASGSCVELEGEDAACETPPALDPEPARRTCAAICGVAPPP